MGKLIAQFVVEISNDIDLLYRLGLMLRQWQWYYEDNSDYQKTIGTMRVSGSISIQNNNQQLQ